MKAILLSAGYGNRLRPLTNVLPKCLLPINGRPLLEYWFSMLNRAGISSVLMNLHYLADLVKEWVKLTEYADIIKMVYEEELLGTGGTLLKNSNFTDGQPVMLIHADNLCSAQISLFIDAHKNRPANTEITMMTFNTSTPETCGIVEIDKKGIVKAFYEKTLNPPGTLANAAVYIVEPMIIDHLKTMEKTFIDFSTEVLPYFVKAGMVYTYYNDHYHRDIGNIESYLTAQIEFPHSSELKDTKNAWALLCKKYDSKFNDNMLSALSSAFIGESVDAEEMIGKHKNFVIDKRKNYVICCSDIKNQLNYIINMLADKKLTASNILIYFPKAPFKFSSRELFEKTGLKSIVLYSSNN